MALVVSVLCHLLEQRSRSNRNAISYHFDNTSPPLIFWVAFLSKIRFLVRFIQFNISCQCFCSVNNTLIGLDNPRTSALFAFLLLGFIVFDELIDGVIPEYIVLGGQPQELGEH